MPELPEVQVVVNELKKYILNKMILNIIVNTSKMIKEITVNKFVSSLINETIIDIQRIGKFIIFKLTNNKIVLSHLRMEGKYSYFNHLKTNKERHHHLSIIFLDNSELRYYDVRMFGTFHLRNDANYLKIAPLSKLGKEPWKITLQELKQKLDKKIIPIKSALLDQTIISGLGNIYVDEVLYECKIHPWSKSQNIKNQQLNCIILNSIKIFEKSIQMGGSSIRTYSSINLKIGNYQNELKVHTLENKLCTRCKTKIIKIKTNGRGTYLCSKCQIKF